MSMYRIGGGFAAAVLAILLVVLTVRWINFSGAVTPSVSVLAQSSATAGAGSGGAEALDRRPTTADVLGARARLQGDEVNQSAPGDVRSAGREALAFRTGVENGRGLLGDWRKISDAQKEARQSQWIEGSSSLPYRNSQILEQPDGQVWRADHNGPVRFGGGWLVLGISLALALFLFARGRVEIEEGRSGQTLKRFNVIERANHWMTASAFILMALTGLVILYGKPLLLPLIGEAALGRLAWWSAWAHMSAAVPFVAGIVVMATLWLRENLIERLDIEWLARFGGLLGRHVHKPSARRFNAGQKLVFWGVVIGGIATLISGILLMLPFEFLGYDGMQWAQLAHAVIGLGMIAMIIGHIYIGTVGMEGAIDAMWSGDVDQNWAREHHDLWFQQMTGGKRRGRGG